MCLFEIIFSLYVFIWKRVPLFLRLLLLWTWIDIICIWINIRAQRRAFILKFLHVFLYYGGSLIEMSLKYVLDKRNIFFGIKQWTLNAIFSVVLSVFKYFCTVFFLSQNFTYFLKLPRWLKNRTIMFTNSLNDIWICTATIHPVFHEFVHTLWPRKWSRLNKNAKSWLTRWYWRF